jgi:hypothetical protein
LFTEGEDFQEMGDVGAKGNKKHLWGQIYLYKQRAEGTEIKVEGLRLEARGLRLNTIF